jgi:hypothetical protein
MELFATLGTLLEDVARQRTEILLTPLSGPSDRRRAPYAAEVVPLVRELDLLSLTGFPGRGLGLEGLP